MLQKAKNIYIRSSFEDPKQIKGMGKMFMLIPQKNVYIETWTEGKKNLTQHPMYDELNKKHTIKFI